MSIEQEIAGLTQSTTDLLDAVNTKKVTLDTAVSNAQTAVIDATSQVSLAAAEKVGAQDARDEAETHKNLAYTYSQSAASAVAYQDLTAIAESKVETAVDVCVYDTRKDSDGGAWRKRAQGTSWYNETLNTSTRGSRKEFPAVAVIVAESNKVTIYDGDDPSLPMWMVFNLAGYNGDALSFNMLCSQSNTNVSVSAVLGVNGQVNIGVKRLDSANFGRLCTINFVSDTGSSLYRNPVDRTEHNLPIAGRNTAGASFVNKGTSLVNADVNDVAMTVLPNAPIDPDTGLPIPTIAVATNGGVGVIKDDGTVVDITSVAVPVVSNVGFTAGKKVIFNADSSAQGKWVQVFDIPDSDLTYSYTQEDNNIYQTYNSVNEDRLALCPNTTQITASTYAFDNYIGGWTANGLGIGTTNYYYGDNGNKNLVNYITSTYNTGWMNGDIKLATLSDTDDTDLVGTGELITNGTFDTDVSGWSAINAVISVDNGTLVVDDTANAGADSGASQAIFTVVGKSYTLSVELISTTSAFFIAIGDSTTFNNVYYNDLGNTPRVFTHTFIAQSSSTLVRLISSSTGVTKFDNISVRLAEPDRSVNGNGLEVLGTVTKEPVATGADLVAYSGFSNSNYLVQPYNPDLDFGTGDFCVMGWVNNTSSFSKHFFTISNSQGTNWGTNGYITVKYNADFSRVECLFAGGGILTDSQLTDGAWHHLCLLRKNGVVYAYLDGKIVASQSNTNNLGATTIDSKFYMGVSVYNGNIASNPSTKQALWRVSKTAPTAEQIAKIYRDEKPLFQENAQATLHGTSNAVTALAYDDSTDLLHVGTSAGRSVFSGLQRVDNTTDAVGTAISASDNFIAEE
jgi:uncharacterized protein (DUF427 family)